MTSKCGKNKKVTHSPAARVSLLCSYHILTIIIQHIFTIIIQHIVTLPKYGHGELNIRHPHTDNRYPAIYVISSVGKKNGRTLQKVTTSQVHQIINNIVS